MSARTLIEVHDLSKSFGQVPVLDRISFELRDDDGVVAFVGPNAAGKSTLFNLLSGACLPDEQPRATIRILGTTIAGLEPWQVARLGVARLFQDARVFPGLTLLENLQVAGEAQASSSWLSMFRRPDSGAGADEALATVGLAGRSSQRAAALSLGDRRKLAIACMLRTGAPLLLLDEPTANLDAAASAQMKELVRALARQRRHVLLIEHNQEFVRSVADTIFAIAQGGCSRVVSSPHSALAGGS